MQTRLIKLIVTVAIVAGVATFMVYSSMGNAKYYKMVDELMAGPEAFEGKTLQVHGYVEHGSINEKIVDHKTTRTFVLQHKGRRILVKHAGPTPDTFKDESEVVAQGRIAKVGGEYTLQATELMAKCPSKYKDLPKDEALSKSAEDQRKF